MQEPGPLPCLCTIWTKGLFNNTGIVTKGMCVTRLWIPFVFQPYICFFISLLVQFCNFSAKLALSHYYTKDPALHGGRGGGYMFTLRTFSADNDFTQEPFTANIKCHGILSKEAKVKNCYFYYLLTNFIFYTDSGCDERFSISCCTSIVSKVFLCHFRYEIQRVVTLLQLNPIPLPGNSRLWISTDWATKLEFIRTNYHII